MVQLVPIRLPVPRFPDVILQQITGNTVYFALPSGTPGGRTFIEEYSLDTRQLTRRQDYFLNFRGQGYVTGFDGFCFRSDGTFFSSGLSLDENDLNNYIISFNSDGTINSVFDTGLRAGRVSFPTMENVHIDSLGENIYFSYNTGSRYYRYNITTRTLTRILRNLTRFPTFENITYTSFVAFQDEFYFAENGRSTVLVYGQSGDPLPGQFIQVDQTDFTAMRGSDRIYLIRNLNDFSAGGYYIDLNVDIYRISRSPTLSVETVGSETGERTTVFEINDEILGFRGAFNVNDLIIINNIIYLLYNRTEFIGGRNIPIVSLAAFHKNGTRIPDLDILLARGEGIPTATRVEFYDGSIYFGNGSGLNRDVRRHQLIAPTGSTIEDRLMTANLDRVVFGRNRFYTARIDVNRGVIILTAYDYDFNVLYTATNNINQRARISTLGVDEIDRLYIEFRTIPQQSLDDDTYGINFYGGLENFDFLFSVAGIGTRGSVGSLRGLSFNTLEFKERDDVIDVIDSVSTEVVRSQTIDESTMYVNDSVGVNRMRSAGSGNDFLIITDGSGDKIIFYDLNGTFVREFGESGTETGQFQFPSRTVVYNSQFYIADSIIKVFESNGVYIREFGSQGTGVGQFRSISDLVFYNDQLYISDSNRDRILVFNPDGTFVREFGEFGRDEGQLVSPNSLVFYNDQLYVSDASRDRILVFNPDGTFVREFGSSSGVGRFNSPRGLVFYNDQLYISNTEDRNILVYNPDGTFVRQFGERGFNEGQFQFPERIQVANDQLYISDTLRRFVITYNPDGTFVREFGGFEYFGFNEGQFRSIVDLLFYSMPVPIETQNILSDSIRIIDDANRTSDQEENITDPQISISDAVNTDEEGREANAEDAIILTDNLNTSAAHTENITEPTLPVSDEFNLRTFKERNIRDRVPLIDTIRSAKDTLHTDTENLPLDDNIESLRFRLRTNSESISVNDNLRTEQDFFIGSQIRLYGVDRSRNSINIYNFNTGELIRRISAPSALSTRAAFFHDGIIYAVGTTNRIYRFNESGTRLSDITFPTPTSPWLGITRHENTLYFLLNGGSLYPYDLTTETFGNSIDLAPNSDDPRTLASITHYNREFYVTESGVTRIRVYNELGEFVRQINTGLPGDFRGIEQFGGFLYASTVSNTIYKLTTEGEVISSSTLNGNPRIRGFSINATGLIDSVDVNDGAVIGRDIQPTQGLILLGDGSTNINVYNATSGLLTNTITSNLINSSFMGIVNDVIYARGTRNNLVGISPSSVIRNTINNVPNVAGITYDNATFDDGSRLAVIDLTGDPTRERIVYYNLSTGVQDGIINFQLSSLFQDLRDITFINGDYYAIFNNSNEVRKIIIGTTGGFNPRTELQIDPSFFAIDVPNPVSICTNGEHIFVLSGTLLNNRQLVYVYTVDRTHIITYRLQTNGNVSTQMEFMFERPSVFDSITITDQTTKQTERVDLDDSVSITENITITQSGAFIQSIFDSIPVSDQVRRDAMKEIQDRIRNRDRVVKSREFTRSQTDAVSIRDDATNQDAIIQRATDVIDLFDVLRISKDVSHGVQDDLNLTDSVFESKSALFLQEALDLINITDSVLKMAELNRVNTDTVDIQDTTISSTQKEVSTTDAIPIRDSLVTASARIISVLDAIPLLDNVLSESGRIQVAFSIVNLADNARRDLSTAVTDTINLVDSVSDGIVQRSREIFDRIGIVDKVRTLIRRNEPRQTINSNLDSRIREDRLSGYEMDTGFRMR